MSRVIPGTCPICGMVPGAVGRDLTMAERYGLLDAGYGLHVSVHGDDIACPPGDPGHFNDALAHFHRAGHPKPLRRSWHERVMGD